MRKWFPVLAASAVIGLMGCSKAQTPENVEVPTGEQVEAAETSDVVPSPESLPKPGSLPDEPAADRGTNEVGDAAAPAVQSAAGDVDESTVAQWVSANNDFGFKMLRAGGMNKSAVISPYSAERALGMTIDGASGGTFSELKSALSLPDAENLSAAGAEIEKIIVRNDNPEVLSIHVDNRLWVNKGLSLLGAYTSSVKSNYLAEPVLIDFAGDPDGSRKTINDDIAKSTENKIRDLLKPGTISPLTRVVLTSAIYFKSPWRHKFSKENTSKDTFYAGAEKLQIDMMRHSKSHPYMQNDELTAFELDFAGNYSLFIAMPNLQDASKGMEALAAMEKGMTGAKFLEMHQSMRGESRRELSLTMPKFRIEYGDSLKLMLSSFGVNAAFDENRADFSRMSTEKLHIDDVIQKAYIDVNEDGAEAAAATAVVMATRAMMPRGEEPVTVKVDHPFIYALVENSTGTALFMGRYLGK